MSRAKVAHGLSALHLVTQGAGLTRPVPTHLAALRHHAMRTTAALPGKKRCSLATPPQTIICSGRPIRISDTGLPCGPSSRQSRVCSCTGCSPALSAVVVGQHLIASPPSPRSLLSMLVARRCCPPTSITSAAPAPDAYVAPPAIVYFFCTRQLWHWASVSRQYALQVRDSRRRVCACGSRVSWGLRAMW